LNPEKTGSRDISNNSFFAGLMQDVGADADVAAVQQYVAQQNYAAPGIEQPIPHGPKFFMIICLS
jgi:hypothetical protein